MYIAEVGTDSNYLPWHFTLVKLDKNVDFGNLFSFIFTKTHF